jgi:hypothetical protein
VYHSDKGSFSMRRTHDFIVRLVSRAGGAHGVRLSGARLAVCENGDIVALDKGIDAVRDVFEDALLLNVLAEDAVKDKDLLAAGRVYGQTGGRCDVAEGAAEALWDEFVARVAVLQWWAHSYSCVRLWLA